jgi:hypothetical protein
LNYSAACPGRGTSTPEGPDDGSLRRRHSNPNPYDPFQSVCSNWRRFLVALPSLRQLLHLRNSLRRSSRRKTLRFKGVCCRGWEPPQLVGAPNILSSDPLLQNLGTTPVYYPACDSNVFNGLLGGRPSTVSNKRLVCEAFCKCSDDGRSNRPLDEELGQRPSDSSKAKPDSVDCATGRKAVFIICFASP